MNSYEMYLNHPAGDIITMEEALQIYTDIFSGVKECKIEDKDQFVKNFITKACKYANARMLWEDYSTEERMANDADRSIKHNAFIDSVNILARVLNSDGIETPWREQLGNQRKRIGDFACFVSYIVGINNR